MINFVFLIPDKFHSPLSFRPVSDDIGPGRQYSHLFDLAQIEGEKPITFKDMEEFLAGSFGEGPDVRLGTGVGGNHFQYLSYLHPLESFFGAQYRFRATQVLAIQPLVGLEDGNILRH